MSLGGPLTKRPPRFQHELSQRGTYVQESLGSGLSARSVSHEFRAATCGSLRGQVTDELGALVVGATVTLVAADGTQRTATTNKDGVYTFNSVAPGAYTLRVVSPGFTTYEKLDLASPLDHARLTTCVSW